MDEHLHVAKEELYYSYYLWCPHLIKLTLVKKKIVENCVYFGSFVSEVSDDASDISNRAWSGFSRTAADNKVLSDSLSSLLWSS